MTLRSQKPGSRKPFLLVVCRQPGTIADDELRMVAKWGGLEVGTTLHTLNVLPREQPPEADVETDAAQGNYDGGQGETRAPQIDPKDAETEAKTGEYGAQSVAGNGRFQWDDAGECPVDLRDYAGVIISGSPYSYGTQPASDDEFKTPAHLQMERRVQELCRHLLAADFPTLGICYGMQSLAIAGGAALCADFPEDLQAPWVSLTPEGMRDGLTRSLPQRFEAYVGHSESLAGVPEGSVVLATGDFCPLQIVRWGNNVYGTQFHPEITTAGMRIRIDTYGETYYPADEKARVQARCDRADVRAANHLISEFARRYR
ncbi:glutamine amidotransferase-related protein [Gleimia hominis]|uniref:glutamine amidotransferase-related protein n=1 Tax=Gleimia hominis TaxID=595468 RepID=UPI001303F5A9|nr:gamma-glutamyl-gamma-aminobutyrate hydrolase family protein [Gleimia hominis]WIK63868.1 gamma-glutamyl-gamma-aminobutyrate hydrolase family protein [Gleimia hominis]